MPTDAQIEAATKAMIKTLKTQRFWFFTLMPMLIGFLVSIAGYSVTSKEFWFLTIPLLLLCNYMGYVLYDKKD